MNSMMEKYEDKIIKISSKNTEEETYMFMCVCLSINAFLCIIFIILLCIYKI